MLEAGRRGAKGEGGGGGGVGTYRFGGQPVVIHKVGHVLESTVVQNIHHWTCDDTVHGASTGGFIEGETEFGKAERGDSTAQTQP